MRSVNLMTLLFCSQLLHAQVLIKNAHVVDVENKKIITGFAVLVSGDKIIAVDKEKAIKLPQGTQVFDATGKYLVPGFTDAHIHFFQSGGLYAGPMLLTCENSGLMLMRSDGCITIWKIFCAATYLLALLR
jgi:hypothetical protein